MSETPFTIPDVPPKAQKDLIRLFFRKYGDSDDKAHRKAAACLYCGADFPPAKAKADNLLCHIYGTPAACSIDGRSRKIQALMCTQISVEAREYAIETMRRIQESVSDMFSQGINASDDVIEESPMASKTDDTATKRVVSTAQNGRNCVNPSVLDTELSSKLIKWCILEGLPFCSLLNTVASHVFVQLNEHFDLAQILPIQSSLSLEYDTAYADLMERINQEERTVNLCLDGWINLRGELNFAVNVQFASNGYVQLLDAFVLSTENHQLAREIAGIIANCVEKIGNQRIGAIISSNSLNMGMGRQIFRTLQPGFQHILTSCCFLSEITYLESEMIKHEDVKQLILCAYSVLSYIQRTNVTLENLDTIETGNGLQRGHGPMNLSMVTLDNLSVQVGFDILLDNELQILSLSRRVSNSTSSNEHVFQTMGNRVFWMNLEGINSILKVISQCKMVLQDNKLTLSDAIRYWVYLTKSIQRSFTHQCFQFSLRNVKEAIEHIVSARSAELPLTLSATCMLLDPRYRSGIALEQQIYKKTIFMSILQIASARGSSSEECKELLGALNKYLTKSEPFSDIDVDISFNPIDWWTTRTFEHPGCTLLADIASLLFTIRPITANSDRIFSYFEGINAKKGNFLSLTQLAMCVSLKQYYRGGSESYTSQSIGRKRGFDEMSSTAQRHNIDSACVAVDGPPQSDEYCAPLRFRESCQLPFLTLNLCDLNSSSRGEYLYNGESVMASVDGNSTSPSTSTSTAWTQGMKKIQFFNYDSSIFDSLSPTSINSQLRGHIESSSFRVQNTTLDDLLSLI